MYRNPPLDIKLNVLCTGIALARGPSSINSWGFQCMSIPKKGKNLKMDEMRLFPSLGKGKSCLRSSPTHVIACKDG